MKQDEQVLLNLLTSCIQGDASEIPANTDWHAVQQLATEQGVAGVVFAEIQRLYNSCDFSTLDTQLKLEWYSAKEQIEKRNIKVNQMLYKTVKCLDCNNVLSILLKGQGLARLYSSPLTRSAGDIDIYVGLQNYEHAKQAFRDGGLLTGEGIHEDIKHFSFSVDGVSIELHRYCELIPGKQENLFLKGLVDDALRFTNEGFYLDGKGNTYSKAIDNSVFVKTLPTEINTLYTFIHLFRHFIGGGIALRQLTDFALLVKQLPQSPKHINTYIEATGFKKPWQVFGCLLVNRLGFEPGNIPCYNAQYNDISERVLEIIFEEGKKNAAYSRLGERRNKLARYIKVCISYTRLLALFPHESFAFFVRLIKNNMLKYLSCQ